MLRVVIADDDEGMRLVLDKALGKIEGIDVVATAKNGSELVEYVTKYSPDAVFTDVEMPSIDGVEAAKVILDINPKTIIVFITAHQEYMPQAFELYAFDYIIKPFKISRIQETVERIKATKNIPIDKPDKKKEQLLIKNREEIALINPNDIVLIQREDRTTIIITEEDKYKTSDSLSEIYDKLPQEDFIRSHKSYIVNVNKIKKLLPYGRWTFIVKFKVIEEDALMTSDKVKELEERFCSIFKG